VTGAGIRTLIIDNYDSFTYNLFHLVAEVTGVPPEVVRNDEPGWTTAELDRFDNIVISPGPGRPERQADFGICAAAIRAASRPLLGVCLGHQGLAAVLGGEIGAAPEPVHGRQSQVVHRQVDILADLPSPFAAVRYHSLLASLLPEELEAIGWTPDGLVMAVRHRHQPMWGVQFHPESVCTEHGHRIMHNFAELTRRWHAARADSEPAARSFSVPAARIAGSRRSRQARPPARPSGSRPTAETATEATGTPPAPPRDLRITYRKLAVDVDAERVFDAFYLGSDRSFWLDSSLPHATYGRFSFMGDTRGPLARVATADVGEGRVTVRSAQGTRVVEGAFFDWIAADLRTHRVAVTGLPFDFALGWVGYLGYELKAECGAARAHRSPQPDAVMLFADRVIAFDHGEQTIYLLALSEEDDDEAAELWLLETAARLTHLADQQPPVPPPSAVGAELGRLELRIDRERYVGLISACQRAIRAGETYEVCLTNMATAEGKLDPWSAYRLLRRDNPAPFGALLRLGPVSVLSCSPERFVAVGCDRWVESKPIKGTRPRGASPAEDERLRLDLSRSLKDRAENLMIVDLVRNDLGICAEVGSVHVEKLFDVETYATVHQLVSTVRARLRPDRSAVDCVRSAFPGGSMTGAPKLRTMSIIDDLEDGPRGVYSGALGYFSLSGAADFSIVIRTLVVDPDRISFGVGGAVIALSEPDAEFEEIAVKATPFLRLLGQEFPDRRTGS